MIFIDFLLKNSKKHDSMTKKHYFYGDRGYPPKNFCIGIRLGSRPTFLYKNFPTLRGPMSSKNRISKKMFSEKWFSEKWFSENLFSENLFSEKNSDSEKILGARISG